MAHSLNNLEDIRKCLLDTIAMVERENEMLSAKIDSLKEPSGLPSEVQDDKKFLEELSLNEKINGISFKNVCKEVYDDSTMKVRADIICGKEESCLTVKVAADGKIKSFVLEIEGTSSLMEIKQELAFLIEDVNLTYTLKAVASFSRMHDVRLKIVEDLLNHYEEFFDSEVRAQNVSENGTTADILVVSAYSRNRRAKYFEATWNLKWNHGKISIEHVFHVQRFQDLSKIPRLEHKLKKLEKNFVERKCSALVQLWRGIAELVAEG